MALQKPLSDRQPQSGGGGPVPSKLRCSGLFVTKTNGLQKSGTEKTIRCTCTPSAAERALRRPLKIDCYRFIFGKSHGTRTILTVPVLRPKRAATLMVATPVMSWSTASHSDPPIPQSNEAADPAAAQAPPRR